MTNEVDIKDAITAADQTFMATFSRGNAADVAALYTEHAQFLLPNSDFVVGRQAIQEAFQAFIDGGYKAIKVEATEVEGFGNTAYEVGKYIVKGEDSQVLDQGKFVVIWKLEAGQWKLHRDIINSSLPAVE